MATMMMKRRKRKRAKKKSTLKKKRNRAKPLDLWPREGNLSARKRNQWENSTTSLWGKWGFTVSIWLCFYICGTQGPHSIKLRWNGQYIPQRAKKLHQRSFYDSMKKFSDLAFFRRPFLVVAVVHNAFIIKYLWLTKDWHHFVNAYQNKSIFERISQQLIFFIFRYRNSDGVQIIGMFMDKPSKRDYPDYYEVIERPMDMRTINEKIKANSYKNISDSLADFHLMFSNCKQVWL